jgi:GNAT superfamily N-acetyltransferase
VVTGLPPGFHLRLAKQGEAERLLDIMLRCWAGTVAPNSTAYRETAEAIAGQLEHGGAGIFVCEGETIVGSGRFLPVPGPPGDPGEWVEIKRVGILKSHRKLGLGAPLVSALEAEAQRRGHPGAQLGVRSDQPRLVAFWASLGYTPADDVQLHVVNPVTPPPTTMRKRFERTG